MAALLFLASVAIFWPGVATYDSVRQFGQALSGHYEDWHPPIVARVWGALHAVFGGGSAPMLVLQLAAYWTGFGLVAGALARRGNPRAAAVLLAIGVLPGFLGWQAVVLKDSQMLGALLAAFGLIAWWRLPGRRLPWWALALVILLIGYATLARANAVFATVPLLVMLFGPQQPWLRGTCAMAGIFATLAVAPVINHRLLGATPTGVERTEAIYDLAGIAVRAPQDAVGLAPDAVRSIAERHCVKPLFWDPLGDDSRCGTIVAPLRTLSAATLYGLLAQAVARAPVAYATHRLAHVNSTERWLVPAGWPGGAPPARSEPNQLGLGSPGAAAAAWQALARGLAETPLGWPIAWVVVAVTGLGVALGRRASPIRDLALAVLVSALMLEASFACISIASDVRYHLWSMVATALATVLLTAEGRWPRRSLLIGGAALALVVGAGVVARLMLPPAPTGYRAQLL